MTDLTKDAATLDNGETLPFHVCTVAAGASSSWPGLGRGPPPPTGVVGAEEEAGTRECRLAAIRAEGDRILNAKSVLIVGGGLIGTELAGDVAGYARKAGKEIEVTLVHSGSQLCPIMSEPAAGMVQKKLERLGVTVFLGDRASKSKDGKMVLQKSGKDLQAEIVVMTTGFLPINTFVKDIPGARDEKGWIQSDENFRVNGSDGKLFAIGDCTTTLPNSGNQIMRNVKVIGHNLKATHWMETS